MRARPLIAALLVVAACARPSVDGASPFSPTPNGDVKAGAEAPAGHPEGGSSDGGAQASGSCGGVPGSSPSAPAPTAAPAPSSNDKGAVGQNALAYLRSVYPRMVIEVDAASGREPNTATLEHVRSELDEVASKPDGISTSVSTFKPSTDRYTIDDIRDLERRLRNTRTTGDTASLYVLFINGRYEDGNEDEEVLGLAYSASGFAIFKDAIASVSSLLVPASAIERSVTLHEIGHILRLINIGYTSPRDHEDPDHPNHSSNRRSVMHWAVESDLISSVFGGPPPDTFDADDLADLADLKAGRL